MYILGGAAHIPLPQVLPVMLAALPLRSDVSEGHNVYSCLVDLVRSSDPSALAILPQILSAFGQTLLPDSKQTSDVKEVIIILLRDLLNSPDANLQQTFRVSLERVSDPAIRTAIQTALTP